MGAQTFRGLIRDDPETECIEVFPTTILFPLEAKKLHAISVYKEHVYKEH